MNKTKNPVVISVREEKCDLLRKIAYELEFPFREECFEDGSVRKFYFKLNEGDTLRLVHAVPRDVYAFTGIGSVG